MTDRVLLLSLRPRFAEAILEGSKTVELRRRPIAAGAGTRVVLYSSAPTMAIVGTARLRTVDVAAPETAWKRHRARLGLTKEEFDGYLDGADQAYLLHLTAICELDEPLHLYHLRESGVFQPPQSFRYVAADDPLPLRELAAQ
ncbi:conserved hypothetical protein [Catenulispora acidiphila DSM 44928]|uniref:ASCH domain-containing protein n=1 Tax=Catenulispora acidiphila (strain DSM 44928 / JCM 14897 / NBRC 102108 / NRRL B-24433 / ID139908) TaxID=479433 RepID=C7Q9K9_CATAD|nr:conserved hypothetical protein [Catenulispora acidiphila DSM 44928]